MVVSQDFEPKKYVAETQFFPCSENIQLLRAHRIPFILLKCCTAMDSSLFFVQIRKSTVYRKLGFVHVLVGERFTHKMGPSFAFLFFSFFFFFFFFFFIFFFKCVYVLD